MNASEPLRLRSPGDDVTEILSLYFKHEDPRALFARVLEAILAATESEYGFVAEVLYEEGRPYLSSWAVSDISWSEETRRWYAEHQASGSPMEFRNLDTLFGWVLRHREPVVTNDAIHDPRRGGVPAGHPELRSFLGMPLERDGELVGMFALANPPHGFTAEALDRLGPLAAATATLIAAYRTEAARRAAESAMRDALAEAERASRAKTEFLSWVSHELRTPLHSILGFAEVLEMRTLAPADASAVEHIRGAGNQLLHLVDDLLDVSRLASGSLVLDAQPVSVDAVVDESIARTAEDAARASVAITFRAGSPGAVQADPGRLQQVLVRLLQNAVTRSPAGSRVEVRSYPAGPGRVHIDVAAEGPVGSSTAGSDGRASGMGMGMGMGMVVAQQLVNAMGGDVHVQDHRAGGSVFTVALPLA